MSELIQTSLAGVAAPDTPDVSIVGAGETALGLKMETVGERLRVARTAARLTITEVAQSLKFSPRQIELLEADNYAALPGNTIVRGFVRSYAKLLKLDAEVLLCLLDTRSPNAPVEVRPPDNMGVASEPGKMRQLSPLVSVAIVLALAALLLGLWHFLSPNLVKKPPTLVSNQSQATSSSIATSASVAESAVPTVAPSEKEAATTATVPPVVTASVQTALVDSTLPPATASASSVINSGPTLQFVFNGRSWLEVTDATKQKLHSSENPAGSRLTLGGRPPYEIVIGNASKVTLTYGERVIDLAPYTKVDVARLTLE